MDKPTYVGFAQKHYKWKEDVMRNKIKKVLQRYGELNANLASEYLVEQLTDDIILALGEDSRDIRYQSLGDDVV